MSTTMIITATVGFVLVVVAFVLCIGGIVTNSWVGGSTSEQEVRTGLWEICSKTLPSDHFTCYVIISENPKLCEGIWANAAWSLKRATNCLHDSVHGWTCYAIPKPWFTVVRTFACISILNSIFLLAYGVTTLIAIRSGISISINKKSTVSALLCVLQAYIFGIGLIIFLLKWGAGSPLVGDDDSELEKLYDISTSVCYSYGLCWAAVVTSLTAAGWFFAVRVKNFSRYVQDRSTITTGYERIPEPASTSLSDPVSQ